VKRLADEPAEQKPAKYTAGRGPITPASTKKQLFHIALARQSPSALLNTPISRRRSENRHDQGVLTMPSVANGQAPGCRKIPTANRNRKTKKKKKKKGKKKKMRKAFGCVRAAKKRAETEILDFSFLCHRPVKG